jgi:hypothetical protein
MRHLSAYRLERRVDASGTVSLWNRTHYVGVKWPGRTVWIQLDPLEIVWAFSSESGAQIRVKPARELTPENSCPLCLAGEK